MRTSGIDPRVGLMPNLDLLSAYKLYEKDYPLFKPDISATLAMNSPLYKRTVSYTHLTLPTTPYV